MSSSQDLKSLTGSEFVTFRLDDEEYCVDIMAVREIRGWTRSTALPHSPEYICGLINLRGIVLPIVDLSHRLGLGATEPSARHVIIVLQISGQIVGLLVDAVSDILTSDHVEFHPTPEVGSGTAKQFVKGVLANAERMIRLLDVAKIMPREMVETA